MVWTEGFTSHTRYTLQGGPTITLNCSPSASAFTLNGRYIKSPISVIYSATVTPITISFTGTTLDSSGQDNILIGQNCSPNFSLPGLPSSLSVGPLGWAVSGDTYESFTWNADQSVGDAIPYPVPNYVPPPPPFYTPPIFYWKDNGVGTGSAPETVTAGTFLSYTSGGTTTNLGPLTATKTVNVWTPDEYDTPPGTQGNYAANPQLGMVGIATANDDVVSNDPSGNIDGYNLQAAVVTPSLFTNSGSGYGDWAWLQLCQIDVTQGGTGTQMASPELDSSFPYNTSGGVPNGVPGTSYAAQPTAKGNPNYSDFTDSPDEGWMSTNLALAFNNNFSLYVMYQPPANGLGTNWVPLCVYKWDFSANMTRSWLFGSWTPAVPGSVVNNGRIDNPGYPVWTSKRT